MSYLSKLYTVSVRGDSSNHLENSFFDFIFANPWALVTGYRKSLLFDRNIGRSSYIEPFVREPEGSPNHVRFATASLGDACCKRKKMKKLG